MSEFENEQISEYETGQIQPLSANAHLLICSFAY